MRLGHFGEIIAVKARDSIENADRGLCTHGNCVLVLYARKNSEFRQIFRGAGFAIGALRSHASLPDLTLAISFGGGLTKLQRFHWTRQSYRYAGCEVLAPKVPSSTMKWETSIFNITACE